MSLLEGEEVRRRLPQLRYFNHHDYGQISHIVDMSLVIDIDNQSFTLSGKNSSQKPCKRCTPLSIPITL